VPLTLLRLDNSHDFAVIEMGANHPGEIAYSSAYARADISVITNIGAVHIEGFGDINGVARSKAEIYHNLSDKGIAVINRDDAFYPYFLEIVGRRQSVSFGLHQDADVRAENIETSLNEQGFQTRFEINTASAKLPIKLNLAGEHNVKNALAAAALAMQLDISLDEIKQGLEAVKPVTGRMQHLRGSKGNIVIDDTYNANPSSLKVALAALNSHDKNWLILGAFGELGADSPLIHKEMGELIKSMPIDRLFATGSFAEQTVKAFGQGAEYFENQEQLIDAVNKAITGKETLLVKGSRAQKMENVVAAMVDNFRAA
jgi:UDP-N-acetylmuramoyl-tripeptide--D-alanyl-D-alanine ligase